MSLNIPAPWVTEIERLREDLRELKQACEEKQEIIDGNKTLAADLLTAMAENERLREALERIEQWSEAFPVDIFPEPDLKKAREVLTAHGMTLDSIAAKAERHIIDGVGKIARAALAKEAGK
jgi:tyrosyl-tRNA synthetase